MTRRASALAGVAVLVVLASCAHDGRTLRAPVPGATAPPVSSTSTTTPGQVGSANATGFTLTSPAFAPGAPIPVVHTCDGRSVSPPLAWGSIPEGTVELALTVTDPDAGGFVHWVMAGIAPSVQAIAEGTVPDGVVQAVNGAKTVGWTGPCPPKGPVHHYVFNLYALSQPSGLTPGTQGAAAVQTLSRSRSPIAALVGTYQRAA